MVTFLFQTGSATKQWDSRFPYSLFFLSSYSFYFLLLSYPRLECKDTQIRGKGKNGRKGRTDGGNSIFIWKSGQGGKEERKEGRGSLSGPPSMPNRGVLILALEPAPESDFNSFWDLCQIRIQEKSGFVTAIEVL